MATKSDRICSAFRVAVICMINMASALLSAVRSVMRLGCQNYAEESHQRYPNLLLITAAEDFIDSIQDFRVADRERK